MESVSVTTIPRRFTTDLLFAKQRERKRERELLSFATLFENTGKDRRTNSGGKTKKERERDKNRKS